MSFQHGSQQCFCSLEREPIITGSLIKLNSTSPWCTLCGMWLKMFDLICFVLLLMCLLFDKSLSRRGNILNSMKCDSGTSVDDGFTLYSFTTLLLLISGNLFEIYLFVYPLFSAWCFNFRLFILSFVFFSCRSIISCLKLDIFTISCVFVISWDLMISVRGSFVTLVDFQKKSVGLIILDGFKVNVSAFTKMCSLYFC